MRYRYDMKCEENRSWSGIFETLQQAVKWYSKFGKRHEKEHNIKLKLVEVGNEETKNNN